MRTKQPCGVTDWNGDLERWLAPFLARLGHKARRRMCPLYVAGLIGPGDRKSVEPMASRLAPGDYDQLHHFIASGVWNEAPLEKELAVQADKLIGAPAQSLSSTTRRYRRRGRIRSAWRRNTPRRSARPPIARRWCR